MKKTLTFLLAAALTGTPALLSSCSDENTEPATPPAAGSNGISATALTPEQQKRKMETVAKAYLAELEAANFNNLNALAKHVNEAYINNEDFENKAVERWFEDIWDGLLSKKGEDSSKETYNNVDRYGNPYTVIVFHNDTYYDRIINLSQFAAHFTAGKNGWTRTDDPQKKADGLKFFFTDQNGAPCELSLKPEGETKKVYVVGENEDGGYTGGYYDWETGRFGDYHFYTDYTDEYVYVPRRVTIKLTQGGAVQLSVVTDIDLSQFNSGTKDTPYNFSKDGVSATTTARVADYSWTVEQLRHDGKDGTAAVKGTMKKGTKQLLSFAATAAGISVGSDNETVNAFGAVNVSADIMGGIQINGTCSDAKRYADLIDKADNQENETAVRNFAAQANALTDIGLYYDGTSEKQAAMKLGVFYEEQNIYDPTTIGGYRTIKEWYTAPVITFGDGSSYTFFDGDNDYFTDDRFRAVINAFNDLIDSYEKLVNWAE